MLLDFRLIYAVHLSLITVPLFSFQHLKSVHRESSENLVKTSFSVWVAGTISTQHFKPALYLLKVNREVVYQVKLGTLFASKSFSVV